MFMSSPAAVRFFNGFGCCYWWPSFTWRELTICQLLKLCLTQVVFTNRVLLKFEFQNLAFKMKDDLQTNVCFKKSFFLKQTTPWQGFVHYWPPIACWHFYCYIGETLLTTALFRVGLLKVKTKSWSGPSSHFWDVLDEALLTTISAYKAWTCRDFA